MKNILFVTTNATKLGWAQKRLAVFGIRLTQRKMEIPEPREFEIEKVAKEKARYAMKIIKQPFIVDDSGYEIRCLKNFPGPYLKLITSTIGAEGVCLLARNKGDKWTNFKSALVYVDENRKMHSFVGNDIGKISDYPRGRNRRHWGEFMRLHIPEGFSKTLAEMNDQEFGGYSEKIKEEDHYVKFGGWLTKQKE